MQIQIQFLPFNPVLILTTRPAKERGKKKQTKQTTKSINCVQRKGILHHEPLK